MLIRVRHTTTYDYDEPVERVLQLLRLDPAERPDQEIHDWRIVVQDAVSLSPVFRDGFGNRLRLASCRGSSRRVTIELDGTIKTNDTNGVTRLREERLPPAAFLRETQFTQRSAALSSFAQEAAGGAESALGAAHALLSAVRTRINYIPGVTNTETTADDALRAGAGVCQDHTHVLIAAARLMRLPARYVSGYLFDPENGPLGSASHAWAEIHIKELGWVGFDAANGISTTERHVPVAIGLDYRGAAPIVGVRSGSAMEAMRTHVRLALHGAEQ